MVTFVLSTPEEEDRERAGRGFRALQEYREDKKGRAMMETIQVPVQRFLNDLAEGCATQDDKIEATLSLPEGQSFLWGIETWDQVFTKLSQLKDTFSGNPTSHRGLWRWMEEASDRASETARTKRIPMRGRY